ncbi:MAG TPA: serpin family protein, partial [Anaerolineales bacterium]|nr:serpin family protein [Anaerolineales bacterium]
MKPQNILLSLLALLGTFFVVAGCAFSGANGPAENPPPSSTVPPPKPVLFKVSEGLVLINNQLALDLYHSLQPTDNVFFSPYSLTRSFAMLYPGARGETAQALDEYFGFNGLGATLPQEMQNLDATLMSRTFEKDGPNAFPQLTFAQALWIQDGMALHPDYQELLQTYFGVPVSFADFAQQPEQAREAIQQWVSEQSAGLLQNPLPAEMVKADTKMLLANAVYFNSAWRFPFDKEIEGKFHSLEGTVQPTQMI